MVVNHFPIIGTILGLGILITSFLFKNISYRNVAYALFIISAIFAFLSMNTGEGAEEIAENLPNVTDKIIHEHEEFAEKLAIILYLLGVISIVGIIADIKHHSKAKLISFLALIVAVIGVIFAKSTGTSGGEIRHTEIREGATNNATENISESTENENED
jgi:uncharacterized membrane protein